MINICLDIIKYHNKWSRLVNYDYKLSKWTLLLASIEQCFEIITIVCGKYS